LLTWRIAAVLAAVVLGGFPQLARAQVDLLSRETFHGVVDLRAAAADGEPSFTDGGFGKARYGAEGAGYHGRFDLAMGAVEWTPRFGWEWRAVVDAGYQPGQEHLFDLYQAYLSYKPVPHSATQFSARFGLFYPPISLEHDARVWGITNTITPSAINSWVGEEVKVAGAEAKVTHNFGGQQLSAVLGVFGYDDTSGTLLSFRGWAFHDLLSQARGSFELPPLSGFELKFQDTETYSTLEIDHRAGLYGQLEWRPSDRLDLQALYYNNRGDAVGVTDDLQWAWATHFLSLGATAQLDEHTRLSAQYLSGRTIIGRTTFRLTDVSFRSAYAMLAHDVGPGVVSVRVDTFQTDDNANRPPVSNGERGWAAMAAYRRPLNQYLDLRLEALHVESTRPSRILAYEPPHQTQTIFQSSLRFTF